MENEFILDNEASSEGLRVTPQARHFLKEGAKWAKFIAIANFAMLGFMVVMFLIIGAFASSAYETMGLPPGMGTGVIVLYVLFIVGIAFFPILYLYRFAVQARQAADFSSQGALEEALSNLKSFYKFIGILLAILLGFYALIILIGIFTGIGSALI